MKGENSKRALRIGFYGVFFAFVTFLMYQAPLISDDFEFADLGYTSLRQILPYVLYYGNGRLLGNIGAVTFVNFPFGCAMIKAAMVCGLIYILPKAIGMTFEAGTLLVCVMTLGLNADMFGQVFTWTSGFMNYVPPVLILFVCIYLVRYKECGSLWEKVVIAALGIAGQLFVEHATVLALLIAGGTVVYRKRNDQKYKSALIWFVACVIGAVIMVMIPKIFHVSGNRTEGYRSIHPNDMVATIIESLFLIVATLGNCWALFAAASVFALALLKKRNKKPIVRTIVYAVFPLIALVFTQIDSSAGLLKLLRYILVYGGMVTYGIAMLADIRMLADKRTRTELMVLIILAMTAVAPFMIIRPFGERCLFLSYIFLCLFVLRGLQCVLEQGLLPNRERILGSLAVIVLVLSAFLSVEFIRIDYYASLRNQYINEQMGQGKTEIVIFDIPSRYSFVTYLPQCYYYYNEPGDIVFTIVEYNAWQERIQSEKIDGI